jgi:hypothetical protein
LACRNRTSVFFWLFLLFYCLFLLTVSVGGKRGLGDDNGRRKTAARGGEADAATVGRQQRPARKASPAGEVADGDNVAATVGAAREPVDNGGDHTGVRRNAVECAAGCLRVIKSGIRIGCVRLFVWLGGLLFVWLVAVNTHAHNRGSKVLARGPVARYTLRPLLPHVKKRSRCVGCHWRPGSATTACTADDMKLF